jgi:lysophospholipase L1-like esterase
MRQSKPVSANVGPSSFHQHIHAIAVSALLIGVMLPSGFGMSSHQGGEHAPETPRHQPTRVACVGDSITEGNANSHPELNSWPVQLAAMLEAVAPGRWDVRNFGKSGATLLKKGHMPYWDQPQFQQALEFEPHIVIINLGTNDATPNNWLHSSEFLDNYVELIERFGALASKPRIYLSNLTPIYPHFGRYVDCLARREETVFYIMRAAALKSLSTINLHTPLRQQPVMFPDGLHPGVAGNTLMAAQVYRAMTGNDAVPDVFKPRAVVGNTTEFIKAGEPLNIHGDWQRQDGSLSGSSRLLAGGRVLKGDFHIRARLRMEDQTHSAAAFVIGGNHFGFEGARGTLFHAGPAFGRLRLMAPSNTVFESGAWIQFEVVRNGSDLWFVIDGHIVDWAHYPIDAAPTLGFRPQRSRMHISDFAVTGDVEQIAAPQSAGYSIPLIDLADHTHRQVVVDREPGQYLGHPTTVLLENDKTMIAVYPKGHGRGPIVMKRSNDAGLTWSKRLPIPDSWASSKEVPTIFRVLDPTTKQRRLILFSGLYPIRMAVSQDDGHSWSELAPIGDYGGIVANACLMRLHNRNYVSLFHDDGRFISGAGSSTGVFTLYQIFSDDGGLTWSAPEAIHASSEYHLCEPGIIRSPDGHQLVILLRENSRMHNSHAMFSNDEAATWSAPVELPAALTGDRHTAVYAPDGRLFISFRDTTRDSPTQGDWVAWVGTFDDIVQGREGQYRIRLMDNKHSWDCAYPGVEIRTDGTIVTTTYGHWIEGQEPYIVSVRLTLNEIDELARKQD